MMSAKPLYQGRARVIPGRAEYFLSSLHGEWWDILRELIDNSFDAGGNDIWLKFGPGNMLIVGDNGRGMGPDILPQDKPTIEKFLQMVETGQVPMGYDVREEIAPESKYSIRWMMEFAGLSAKTGKGTIGRQGLAVLGARRLGPCTWHTRQDPVSALAYWGDTPEGKNPPVVILNPATLEQAALYNTQYTVDITDEPLLDFRGERMDSGTIIVFDDIYPEAKEALNAKVLISRLQQRYGPYIREGAHITVINEDDRLIELEPPEEEGVELLNKRFYLLGGKGEFEQGFFDIKILWIQGSTGRKRGPMLRFEKTDRPLIEIRDFNEPPFNRQDIGGYITYPNLPPPPDGVVLRTDEVKYLIMTPDKKDLVEGSVRKKWVNIIMGQREKILDELRKYERNEREHRVQSLSGIMAQVTVEVLKQDDDYASLVKTLPVKQRKSKSRGAISGENQKEQSSEMIEVLIYNQWNRRTRQSVTLRLTGRSKKKEPADEIITTKNGFASFMMPEPGRYKVEVMQDQLPQGATVTSTANYTLNVEDGKPQPKLLFNLKTTEKMPNRGHLPRFAFWFHAWPNSRQPWRVDSLQEDWGQFEINTAGSDLRFALDADDMEGVLRLLAVYVASGMCKFVYKNEPDVDLALEISLLTPKLERRYLERYQEMRRYGKSRK
jgi:hypothetical protein